MEAKKVAVTYQNLTNLRVNYYLMDIELLFSRNPFVGQYSGQFGSIRPNATAEVTLDPKKTTHAFDLPEEFRSRNVLIELVSGAQRKTATYFSNALNLAVVENYAQIRVTHETTGKALSGVYVKVYARMRGGPARFFKDGYTDLRGRFDYGSLSTNELDNVERFSILVLSEEHGATVREAAPPKR